MFTWFNGLTMIRRALISVSNKTGLVPFAKQLVEKGIAILATGGTAALLKQEGVPSVSISDFTGFPEIMGGRVKTLHPKIYAGLLRRPGIDDAVMQAHQIEAIDLVIVNLYPFQETIAKPGCSFAQAIEQIDIGGPAMLRAAAKNHIAVTTIVDPQDYATVLTEIQQAGQTTPATRQRLAKKVFQHTSEYDQAIFNYLAALEEDPAHSSAAFPQQLQPVWQKRQDLRYGENPHQAAALYADTPAACGTLAAAELLQGKPLSYNNLLDSDAALNCVRALNSALPGCAIIKHATPCGVAQADSVLTAYQQALTADPTSAFGGIIALNRPLDAETAQAILDQQFVEVLLAPEFTPQALQILCAKPAWRLLAVGKFAIQPAWSWRSISGGILVQQEDWGDADVNTWTTATERSPTPAEWLDLHFAWRVVQFVKSNAIVYAKNQTTLGIGGGQTSRVFSAEIAVLKAKEMHLSLTGAVCASDAFFPFTDSLEIIAKAGVTAVIQPGGSKRDAEVIAAANQLGIAMVLTGRRHFRH